MISNQQEGYEMRKEKIFEVVEKYRKLLQSNGITSADRCANENFSNFDSITLSHCYWMIERIKYFLSKDNLEKANRWLGFVQGCLWCTKIRTIQDMRDDNREVTE